MQYVQHFFLTYVFLILGSTFFLRYVKGIIGERVRAAGAEEYPFVVSIGQRNPEMSLQQNHICTGTIISNKHVLTAAHCLNNRLPENVQVTYGTIDLSNGNRYNVASWLTYTQWASIFNKVIQFVENDIAILELSEPITQANVTPVRLSSSNSKQSERSTAAIVGFGNDHTGITSRFLLTAYVTILSSDDCNDRFLLVTNKMGIIPENEFCSAAEPYALIRNGDSGGPLLNMHHELVGINQGTSPKYSWYQESDSVDFLIKYKINTHISVHHYREFIEFFQ